MPRALFVRAPGPGAVLRLIQRRLPDAGELLLSDAGAGGWRALRGPEPQLTAAAPLLAAAFPPEVFLLERQASCWTWTRWGADGVSESGGGIVSAPTLWERLPGWPRPESPDALWARRNGLPLERALRPDLPVVEYETIAALDQRSLLVEIGGPRLYRFHTAAAGSAAV